MPIFIYVVGCIVAVLTAIEFFRQGDGARAIFFAVVAVGSGWLAYTDVVRPRPYGDDPFNDPTRSFEDHPQAQAAGLIAAVLVLLALSVIYFAFPELVTNQPQAPTEAGHAD